MRKRKKPTAAVVGGISYAKSLGSPTITVKAVGQVNRTDAMPLLAQGLSELIQAGLQPAVCNTGWDDEAVVAYIDERPVGVMSFAEQKWDKTLWVKLGYVLQRYRRFGVYRAMWLQVVEIARAKKALEIWGATHISNGAMQTTMQKLGREVAALQYRFVVPPATDQGSTAQTSDTGPAVIARSTNAAARGPSLVALLTEAGFSKADAMAAVGHLVGLRKRRKVRPRKLGRAPIRLPR
jgi:GNAT superfamily N-acetyltransferase